MMMEFEESYADEPGLELGLGLSLGVRKNKVKSAAAGGSWEKYARILTAKDFDFVVSAEVSSSSSSSSSSSVTKANNSGSCGTKRSAYSPSSPTGRQVVGWPPIRAYRMNSLANHGNPPVTENYLNKNVVGLGDKINQCTTGNANLVQKEKGLFKMSSFVKVTMDGIPIGRKVDLNAHTSYQTLARSLDEMFRPCLLPAGQDKEERDGLLNGLSEFVLTYEDKDGDWMLVGDVPWDMFLNSVRRLRIMRSAEAKGLAPMSGTLRR